MHISIATANLYYLPFYQALEIIADAGSPISNSPSTGSEAVGPWPSTCGMWARGRSSRRSSAPACASPASMMAVGSSTTHTIEGFVNPHLAATLDELGYAPENIVFHTPHIEGAYDQA